MKIYSLNLVLIFLLQFSSAQSQRIFTATGIVVSTLDDNIDKSYKGTIIRPSISLGFETKQWKRLSLSTNLSTFTSGGKREINEPGYFDNAYYFDNYSIGATGNFYMVNAATQFYFGIGPRLDYISSQQATYTEWNGNGYTPVFLHKWIWGITGSIGVNFQLSRFNLGIKSNYYYRYRLYSNGNMDYYTNKTHQVRDNVFDLQLVFGFTLGKKKQEQKFQ